MMTETGQWQIIMNGKDTWCRNCQRTMRTQVIITMIGKGQREELVCFLCGQVLQGILKLDKGVGNEQS